MPRLASTVAALGLATLAAAQSTTVTQYFLPILDPQPLVASVIGQTGGVATLAVGCANGTDSSDCGFTDSITITVGPSTLHVSTAVATESATYDIGCVVTGTTTATCSQTYTGPAAAVLTDTAALTNITALTAITSFVSTTTFAASDITYIPITITAGLENVSNSSAIRTSSSSIAGASAATSSHSSSSSGSHTSSTATSTAASSTATSNVASTVAHTIRQALTGGVVAAVMSYLWL